jgi:DNA-binding CsgD family transcriptional regulator
MTLQRCGRNAFLSGQLHVIVQIENLEVTGLPRRQAETLAYVALGYSNKEAGRAMHISPRTVEDSLSLAMSRFGARSRAHMITRAVAAGALFIRHSPLVVLAICLTILASLPLPHHKHDDVARLTTRVRVRRQDEYVSLDLDPMEDYA